MVVNDTCKCGAKFHVRSLVASSAAGMWAAWVNAHRTCRGSNTIIEVDAS